MRFTLTAERVPFGAPIRCKATAECDEDADFEVNDFLACREHLWLVLMHEHRKVNGVRCMRCIPGCDNER